MIDCWYLAIDDWWQMSGDKRFNHWWLMVGDWWIMIHDWRLLIADRWLMIGLIGLIDGLDRLIGLMGLLGPLGLLDWLDWFDWLDWSGWLDWSDWLSHCLVVALSSCLVVALSLSRRSTIVACPAVLTQSLELFCPLLLCWEEGPGVGQGVHELTQPVRDVDLQVWHRKKYIYIIHVVA